MRTLRSIGLSTLVVALLAPSLASGSVVRALSLEALAERSDEVFVGLCTHEESRFEGDRIVTEVTLRVVDGVAGAARAGDTRTLVLPGGVVGDLGMRVEGMPRFRAGEESMLFLAHGRRARPVGMSQGVLPVRIGPSGDRVVHPGGAGLALVERQRGRLVPAPGALLGPTPLGELRARVRDAFEATH